MYKKALLVLAAVLLSCDSGTVNNNYYFSNEDASFIKFDEGVSERDINIFAKDSVEEAEKDIGCFDYSEADTAEVTVTTYEVYSDPLNRFSFSYPADWKILSSGNSQVEFGAGIDQFGNAKMLIEVELLQSETGGPDDEFIDNLKKRFVDTVVGASGQLKVDVIGTGEHFAIFALAKVSDYKITINLRCMNPTMDFVASAKKEFADLVLSLKVED